MSIIENIIDKIKEVKPHREKVFSYIESAISSAGARLDAERDLTGHHESINSLKSRSIIIITLFESLGWAEIDFDLVPYNYLDQFYNSVASILQEIIKLEGIINDIEVNGGIGSIDIDAFNIRTSNNAYDMNISSGLVNLDKEFDRALEKFYNIRSIVKSKDIISISNIKKEIKELYDFFEKNKSYTIEMLKQIENNEEKTTEINSKASIIYDEIKSIEDKINIYNQTSFEKTSAISNAELDIKSKLSYINQQYEAAKNLSQMVIDYQADFESFKNSLDARKKAHSTGTEQLDSLVLSLKNQESEIIRINTEASAALRNATVAGLAKGYADKTDKLNTELARAYDSVKNSLTALFLSSLVPILCMAASAIDISAQTFSISTFIDQFNISNVIILSLFIAPSAWFSKFSITRYNNIFRLREHYDHKFSTTFAFDGFSEKMADGNKDEITQLTFVSLARSNPASTLPKPKQDNCDENPISFWDKILDKLLETLGLQNKS